MKNLYVLFIFITHGLFGAASSSNEPVPAKTDLKCPGSSRNLIMFLDTNAESLNGFLTRFLNLAFSSKVAPIIVSDTVLYQYLRFYAYLVRYQGHLSSWHAFKHNDAGIYIFVPKGDFEREHATDFVKSDYTDRELSVGLAVDHANIMQQVDSSYDELFDNVTRSVMYKAGLNALFEVNNQFPLESLLDLFVKGKSLSQYWNIFLSGHGFFEPTQDEWQAYWESNLNQLSAPMQQLEQLPQSVVTQDEVMRKSSELNRQFIEKIGSQNIFNPTAEEILNFFHHAVSTESQPALLRVALEEFIQKARGAFNQALKTRPESHIAGLAKPQFIRLLDFLKNEVNTSFLYYTTCFGGGVNLATVEGYLNNEETEVTKKTNPNFIIAAGAVADSTVISMFDETDAWNMERGKILEHKYNFKLFFDLLCQFLAGSSTFVQDPFKKIFAAISSSQPKTDSNVDYFTDSPSVYFPGAGVFRAIEVDNDIKVLTNVLVRSHEAEDKWIDARDKHAILLYPEQVRVPVAVGIKDDKERLVWPAFVSMIPGPAVHHLKEVIAPDIDYVDFIASGFTQVDYAYPKTWIIDRLILSRFNDYTQELLSGYENLESYVSGAESLPATIPEHLIPPKEDQESIIIEDLIIKQASIKRELSGLGEIVSRWNIMFRDRNTGLYYIFENYTPDILLKFEKARLTDSEATQLKERLFGLSEDFSMPKPDTAFELGKLGEILQKKAASIKSQ